MEPIITRIKNYVLVIDPTIDSDAFLDFIVRDVVDRALIYMNRAYLVAQYEADLLDNTVEETDYVLPIPSELERPLAGSIISTYKTIKERNTASTNAISSMEDNGQKISYSDKLQSYSANSKDTDVLTGLTSLLDEYKLGKVLSNDYTRDIQDFYQ